VGGKFGLGVTAYVPTNTLILFEMFEPSLPRYFMYENRLQRFVAAAGVGGEIVKGVSVGASVDLLASADVEVVMTVDATLTGADPDDTTPDQLIGDITVDTHRLALRVKPDFAPVLGLQIHPGEWIPALEGLAFGATWHGTAGLDIDAFVDVQANVEIADVGDLEPYVTSLILQSRLAMLDHYVPPRTTIGLAYQRADTFAIYGEGRFTDWRKLIPNVARVQEATITSPLVDVDDQITDGNAYGLLVRPAWAWRMGVELHLPEWAFNTRWRYLRLTGRGGFAYEQTPLVGQGEGTAMLDTDRTAFTLGAGGEFWDPLDLVDAPVRLDVFGQLHLLAPRTLSRPSDVPVAGNPVDGGVIPVGGRSLAFGAQWTFAY
jgi:long-subunit fatty acid transport protein